MNESPASPSDSPSGSAPNPQTHATPQQPIYHRLGTPEQWRERTRVFVDRGSRATGLDPVSFVPIAVGGTCMVVLMLITLLNWWRYDVDMALAGVPIETREAYRGIAYGEGKCVFVLMLFTGTWLALGLLRKSWLAGGIIASGAAAVFAFITMFTLRSRLASRFAGAEGELDKSKQLMETNPMMKMSKEALESMGGSMPEVSGGPTWSLAFGILLALAIAVALAAAGLRHPQPLPFFERPGMPPIVSRHGTLGAAYGIALLTGIAFAIIRY